MNTNHSIRGAMIASAVAALFGCANSTQQAAAPSGETAGVKCSGINSCKGQGTCATADHSCGKHTPCKGQGWLVVDSAEECTAKGGQVI
jgi:hypothetical protein